MTKKTYLALAAATLIVSSHAQASQPISLYAAGSLKAALSDVVGSYEAKYAKPVAKTFGPSGLLRKRIEKGEKAQVFASANMKHPKTLASNGKGGPVALFSRNKLCALSQGAVPLTEGNLLQTLLDPTIRLGTSTPKADPSGDYAWQLFAKSDAVLKGSRAKLEAKALKLTGGPTSAKAPKGRNQYGWVMENNKADVFLTYCTNAILAQKQVPSLKVVQIPENLSVGADYGLIVLDNKNADAWHFAFYILSEDSQKILANYGFKASAISTK